MSYTVTPAAAASCLGVKLTSAPHLAVSPLHDHSVLLKLAVLVSMLSQVCSATTLFGVHQAQMMKMLWGSRWQSPLRPEQDNRC
ncbi:hypothetical protein OH76DRAFT_1399932 [Lentinus brumalis]|uniref:Uncharacterized protein n=1 Tax=Lentinus brumalis TaxID=2498619 RepID=A0A371DJH7_9APHY|nr:hypothetical protein OH76DRAFT_1399932 [Polyporus brumalis]